MPAALDEVVALLLVESVAVGGLTSRNPAMKPQHASLTGPKTTAPTPCIETRGQEIELGSGLGCPFGGKCRLCVFSRVGIQGSGSVQDSR